MTTSFVVIGLGYGDEGKGACVDSLVRKHKVPYVLRFNGGPQAAHNVVSPEGIHHCFSQLGAGTLVPGTKTILSHYMLVNPLSLLEESKCLTEKGITDSLDRLMIDRNCPVITPFNSLLNKIIEISRNDGRHGSCGAGVGLTQKDVGQLKEQALYVRDLNSPGLSNKLKFLHQLKLNSASKFLTAENKFLFDKLRSIDIQFLIDFYSRFTQQIQIIDDERILRIIRQNDVVFEGAQGVLLDQTWGFFPNVTRSNTSFVNALELIKSADVSGETVRIGLLRGYATRHGAGPFVTEDKELVLEPCDNKTNQWQGNFRLGWFDCVAAKYALELVGGVDILAITNLDRMFNLSPVKICTSYQTDEPDPGFFEGSDGVIKRILPIKNLEPQRSLIRTRLLNGCKPIYESLPEFDVDNYVSLLENRLGHEVKEISISPTYYGRCDLGAVSA
jgi:adenylosuccinate synthase